MNNSQTLILSGRPTWWSHRATDTHHVFQVLQGRTREHLPSERAANSAELQIVFRSSRAVSCASSATNKEETTRDRWHYKHRRLLSLLGGLGASGGQGTTFHPHAQLLAQRSAQGSALGSRWIDGTAQRRSCFTVLCWPKMLLREPQRCLWTCHFGGRGWPSTCDPFK